VDVNIVYITVKKQYNSCEKSDSSEMTVNINYCVKYSNSRSVTFQTQISFKDR